MARQVGPDPYQQDYEREKAAGFPQAAAHAPQPASAPPLTSSARPAATVPPRKLIAGGVVVILIIIAAIVGHAIASSSSIAAGDCVVTNPSAVSGWDIKKVACGSSPALGQELQKVISVQSGSNGQCDLGLTTFQDQPSNQTYCLASSFGNGG